MVFRLLLWGMIAYIAFRIIQLTMRIMSSGRRRGGEDPFASPPPQPPSEQFKNIEDADFEDLTPRKPEEPPTPPKEG
ncbi:MAG: hypothetical protein AB1428_10895 [Bacteroidota bacterium]